MTANDPPRFGATYRLSGAEFETVVHALRAVGLPSASELALRLEREAAAVAVADRVGRQMLGERRPIGEGCEPYDMDPDALVHAAWSMAVSWQRRHPWLARGCRLARWLLPERVRWRWLWRGGDPGPEPPVPEWKVRLDFGGARGG